MKLETVFRNGLVEVTSSSVEDELDKLFQEVPPLEAHVRKSLEEALSARMRESGGEFIYMDAPLERVIVLEPGTMIAPLFERTDKVTIRHPESTLPGPGVIGAPLLPPFSDDVLERVLNNMAQLVNMAKPQDSASEGMWFIDETLEYELSGEGPGPKRSWGAKRLRRWRNGQARKKGSP